MVKPLALLSAQMLTKLAMTCLLVGAMALKEGNTGSDCGSAVNCTDCLGRINCKFGFGRDNSQNRMGYCTELTAITCEDAAFTGSLSCKTVGSMRMIPAPRWCYGECKDENQKTGNNADEKSVSDCSCPEGKGFWRIVGEVLAVQVGVAVLIGGILYLYKRWIPMSGGPMTDTGKLIAKEINSSSYKL